MTPATMLLVPAHGISRCGSDNDWSCPLKQCTGCGEWLALAEFGKHVDGKGGLRPTCKPCHNANNRAYRKANPEVGREYRLAHLEEERENHLAYNAANGERTNAERRAAHAANPEVNRAKDRARHAANPERKRETKRKWYAANRVAQREYKRKYTAANPVPHRAAARRWRDANPEAHQLSGLRRRTQRAANGVFVVTVKEIKRLLAQPCYLCGVAASTAVDHIIPIVKGGRHSIGNLLGVCRPCNSSKNDKLLIEYRHIMKWGAV